MDRSVVSTWEHLSHSELFHVASVIGRNDKLRFDLLRQIQQRADATGQRRQNRAIPFSYAIRHQICFLCCGSFSRRGKAVACVECMHNFCTVCMSKSKRLFCALCAVEKKVDRQRSDHRRLFHAGSDRCYDWAKIADFKIADPQALLFDECYWVFNERYWVARAIIEIRLMLLFGIGRLDGYSAYITLPGDALRSLSRRLAALIKETLIHTLSELMDGNGTDLWTIHSDRLQELQLVIEKEVKLFCGAETINALIGPTDYAEECRTTDFEQQLANVVINAAIIAETMKDYQKASNSGGQDGLILFRGSTMSNLEFLLLKHSNRGHWTPPKGHNDPGESDLDAAIRETEEESGLKRTDYEIVPGFRMETKYTVPRGEKLVIYFLAELTTKDAQIRLSKEHTDFAWLSLDAACDRIEKDHTVTKEALRKAAEFLGKSGRYGS